MKIPTDRSDRLYLSGIVLLGLVLLATIIATATGRNDLDIFRDAARDLLAGKDPYVLRYNEWYSYFYSPFFALLISPLLWLGPVTAKVLWGLLMLLMAGRSARLMAILAGPEREAAFRSPRTWFWLLLLLLQPLRDNINSSQVTVLVVWACLEGLHQFRAGRWPLAALLIGVAIDMKLIPLVLLPYLVYRGRWQHALAVISAVALVTAIPGVVLGWERYGDLLASRNALIDPSDVRHVLDEEEPSFISLGSLLSAYLSTEGGSSHTLDLPRTLAHLDVDTISFLLWTGRLLLAGLALFFLRLPPFRPAASSDHVRWEIGYLLLCTILVFPHQRNYSMFLAAPALCWLVMGVSSRASWRALSIGWKICWVLVFLGLNAEFIVGEFAPIYAHYKLKSFLVLLLIGMLAALPPERVRPAAAPVH